jgi:hypothetical protein
VRAIADDPETAAALANAYANAVIEVRGDAVRQAADEAIGAIQADLASSDTMSSSTVDALESRLSEIELMRVIGDPTVAVAEAAEVPLSPDGSPTFLVIITGLLVGVILAPGAALIVDRLGRRRRLMEEDELAEVHPLPCSPACRSGEGRFRRPGSIQTPETRCAGCAPSSISPGPARERS